MNQSWEHNAPPGIFTWMTAHPWLALLLSAGLLIPPLLALPGIVKDTRSDAFLAVDNPALVYKEKVRREFGLNDPVVVAILDDSPQGIFRPATLQLVQELTAKIRRLDNIQHNRVASLATERDIRIAADEIDIRPFLEPLPQSDADLLQLRNALAEFDLYEGNLISTDGKMTLILAEMIDETRAQSSYDALRTLLDETVLPPGVELHLAGEGAIAGYLGQYIDSDALRLNPLAGLIINLIIVLAFLRLVPALLSNVIIIASAGIALGAMAYFDIAFFVITNALPVILIGISVADAIHIYTEYFRLRARYPELATRETVARTMSAMWRPLTLTTVTTMCGFLGLYLAAFMPPFKYFGLFAALGVFVAWVFSLLFLPAALVLTAPQPSRQFTAQTSGETADIFGRLVNRLGQASLRHYRATIILALVLTALGGWGASRLVIEEDRIDLFHPSEPVYRADKAINQHMDGTNILYVVVEASANDGLLEPSNLEQMAALQTFAVSLENVGGSVSIVDYIKHMNAVMSVDEPHGAAIPASKEAVAQYLFAYSALGDAADFEEEIDYDYRTAVVRLNLKAGSFLAIKPVIEQLQAYVDDHFRGELSATLSGRATLNYYWFKDLGSSHFAGMLMALSLVWLVSSVLFRSALAGLLALVPVAGSVLLVYAAMVALGMTLGIGSSMFAAVAIGLGVDFAIHALDRLRTLYSSYGNNEERVYTELFHSTGRALFFNFLAIACGFGVLISSKIVSLNQFGSIVVLAVATSFLASLTLLPALVKLTRPACVVGKENQR